MGRPPLAHVLDIYGAPVVLLVLRFAYPAAVAGGLAGLAAPWLGAELLMPPVAKVG